MVGGPLRVWWSKTGKYPCTSGVSLHMGALTNPKSELQSGSWGVLELGLDHGVNASMSMRRPQVGSNGCGSKFIGGANRQVLVPRFPLTDRVTHFGIPDFLSHSPAGVLESLETDPSLAAWLVASLHKNQLPPWIPPASDSGAPELLQLDTDPHATMWAHGPKVSR